MTIIHPSLGYIYLRGILKIIWINCFRHFGFSRFIMTWLVLAICLAVWLFNTIFRLLDEVFFPDYRRQVFRSPAFIISPPRSGTTFLQRNLAVDRHNYFTPRLYQVLFPSITVTKIVKMAAWMDRSIGSPFYRIGRLIGSRYGGVWKGIHRLGLGLPEEDEGLWFLSFLSPAWGMIVPYFGLLGELNVLDHFHSGDRQQIMVFYKNFLMRMQFLGQPGSSVLIKSVMSSGRIEMIASAFEDARFICIDRDPLKSVPSYISMFSAPWRWHSRGLPDSAYQSLGQSAIEFHNHLKTYRGGLASGRLLVIAFADLIGNPYETMERIYNFLERSLEPEIKRRLEKSLARREAFKSAHKYRLEDYGYTAEHLQDVLK